MDDSLQLLHHQLQAGNYVLFLGAGVAVEAGLPTWGTALRKLAVALEPRNHAYAAAMQKDIEAGRFLEAADLFFMADVSEEDRARTLDAVFGGELTITERLRRLARSNYAGIVTTNYDRCLIEAAAQERVDLVQYGEGSEDLAAARLGRRRFHVRLHGRIEVPSSIVLAGQHYKRLKDNLTYPVFAQWLLSDACLVFFGFSFTDPYLRAILRAFANATSGRTNQRHYALLPADPPLDIRELLRSLNVEPIVYDPANGHAAGWSILCNTPTGTKRTENLSEERLRRQLASILTHLRFRGTSSVSQSVLAAVISSEMERLLADGPVSLETLIDALAGHLGIPPAYASDLRRALEQLTRDGLIEAKDGSIRLVRSLPENLPTTTPLRIVAEGVLNRAATRFVKDIDSEKDLPLINELLLHLLVAEGLEISLSLVRTTELTRERLDALLEQTMEYGFAGARLARLRELRDAILSVFERPEPSEEKALDEIATTTFAMCTTVLEPSLVAQTSRIQKSIVSLDASIVLPWICEGHQAADVYGQIIQGAGTRAGIPRFYLNEVVSHRSLALTLYHAEGLDSGNRFRSYVRFSGVTQINAYLAGYAGLVAGGYKKGLEAYLAEFAPFKNESGAGEFLERKGLRVFPDENSNFYVLRGIHSVEECLQRELPTSRSQRLLPIKHDAKMIIQLVEASKCNKPATFVTADRTLISIVAREFPAISDRLLMPFQALGLAQSISTGRNAVRGLARALWHVRKDDVTRVRDYYIERILEEFEPALLGDIPDILKAILDEAERVEATMGTLEYAHLDGTHNTKLFRALDQFEDLFHKKMREAKRRHGIE